MMKRKNIDKNFNNVSFFFSAEELLFHITSFFDWQDKYKVNIVHSNTVEIRDISHAWLWRM